MNVFDFIGKAINPVIAVLGAVVLVCLLVISGKLGELGEKVKQEFQGSGGKVYRNRKTLDLKQRDTALAKRDETYPLRKSFDELCAKYLTVAQIIPVFPLLGILGTVSGLIAQVSAQDASQIYASLDTALSTTFWGLVATIVLKFVETLLVQKKINEIETEFNDYDIKYQDAVSLLDAEEEV